MKAKTMKRRPVVHYIGRMKREHADALATFKRAGFWHEDFLGAFMFQFKDGRTLTCAHNWSGDSGMWEAQLHGPRGEELGGRDFTNPEGVINWKRKCNATT